MTSKVVKVSKGGSKGWSQGWVPGLGPKMESICMVPRGGSNDVLHAGLGNTRGSYCNSNSRGSELPGIGQFLSPVEL